jgi:DNA-binding NarL/FixJ family response regulator
MFHVLVVDDHPTVREGLTHRISSQADMDVCGEATNVRDALELTKTKRPDVAIVDIALKDSDGLDFIKMLRARHPHVRAVVHSMFEESVYGERCLNAGALGYVNKEANPDDVIAAIREVLKGKLYLSPPLMHRLVGRSVRNKCQPIDPIDSLTDRQLEIFRMIGQGRSAAQIAQSLFLSVHTIESHRDNIKRKLSVSSLSELTRMAVLWSNSSRVEV